MTENNQNNPVAGPAVLAAAALAVLIWAGTPIVTKFAVARIDPMAVGMLRTVIAALVAIPAALVLRLALPRGRRQWRLLVVSALSGFVAFPLLFTIGLRYTSASHAALILAALPIFTGLFAAAADRRAPSIRWVAGAALALVGEAFLIAFRVGFGDQGQAAGDAIVGDILIVSGGLAASLGYVAGGRLASQTSSWSTTLWGIGLAGIILAPALWLLPGSWMWAGPGIWFSVAYLAIGSSILAYVAWYWALGRGGVARIALVQFAQPVVTVLLGVALLGEAVTAPLVLSAAVILCGIFLAQKA